MIFGDANITKCCCQSTSGLPGGREGGINLCRVGISGQTDLSFCRGNVYCSYHCHRNLDSLYSKEFLTWVQAGMKIAQKAEVGFNRDIAAFCQLNCCKTWWTGAWALPSDSRSAALPWIRREALAPSHSLGEQKLLEDLTVIRWTPPRVSSSLCAHQNLLIVHIIVSSCFRRTSAGGLGFTTPLQQ